MRDLTIHEISDVNGGFYFSAIIDGVETGLFMGAVFTIASIAAGAPLAWNASLSTGAMIGGFLGLAEELAFDADMMLIQATVKQKSTAPAAAA